MTRLERLAQLWTLVLFGALATLYAGWNFDDPFITYRYARNLAYGRGFVYNIGERVLSTTTPFLALLLAPLEQMGAPTPFLASLLGATTLTLSGYLLWRLGYTWQQPWSGFIAMMLFPFLPYVRATLGGEMPLLIFFVLLTILTYTHGRTRTATLLLGIATLTRSDALLLAPLLGVHAAWERRPHLRDALLIYIGMLMLWHGWLWWYYGAPLPATLAAKRAQATLVVSQTFAEGLLALFRHMANTRWGILLLGMALFGLLRSWQRAIWHTWGLVIGWGLLQIIGYTLLGVSRYFWYYIPLMLGFAVSVGIGSAALLARLDRRWRPIGGIILLLFVVLPGIGSFWATRTVRDDRLLLYRDVGRWLHEESPPEAIIGALEIGIIGYYAERPMLDFAGLLQPEVTAQMYHFSDYDQLARWAVERYAPEYVVVQAGALPGLEAFIRSAHACRVVQEIARPESPRRMQMYACDDGGRRTR